LLGANAVAYVPNSASGAAFLATLDKLAITNAVTSKARAVTSVDEVTRSVAMGDADLAVLPVSEILSAARAPGAAGATGLGAAFPPDIQSFIVMGAGIGARSARAGAAREFVQFLMADRNTSVLRANGMER
jgi:ABC-type molybdate transport system substrate-binding protein